MEDIKKPNEQISEEVNSFNTLYNIDVRSHVEQKNGLDYLSWSWAWAELCKIYPNATFEFKKFQDAYGNIVPYQDLGNLGFLVTTSVTVNGLTREMSLPVMDASNKAMKREAYEYEVYSKKDRKTYKRKVEACDIMDINKTLWRCLVKNIAMFGLGLKVYSGEDLPEAFDPVTGEAIPATQNTSTKQGGYAGGSDNGALVSSKQIEYLRQIYGDVNLAQMVSDYGYPNLESVTRKQASEWIDYANEQRRKAQEAAMNVAPEY